MNALYAMIWGEVLQEPRLSIPFTAMGYQGKAGGLRAILDEIPDEPANDRTLIERWAAALGLTGAFHFNPYLID